VHVAAQQIIVEIGRTAGGVPLGVCPGEEVTAGETRSSRSPKGNRALRRLLNQAAHAAVKMKESIFEVVFKRLQPRLKYKEAIWAIAPLGPARRASRIDPMAALRHE
jgi:transposase